MKNLIQINGIFENEKKEEKNESLDYSNVDGYDLSHLLGSQNTSESQESTGTGPTYHYSYNR